MVAPVFNLVLLAVMAFSLAACLEPWFQAWAGNRTQSANVLQVAMGDSRRLFSRHFSVKADVYFHNGAYPSIYDDRKGYETAHMAADMHHKGEEEEAGQNFLGPPRDWLDRFSRHLYPSRHTHLGDASCGHPGCKESHGPEEPCKHEHEHEADHAQASSGIRREILPWLRVAAELDPERVEIYVVSSFWLRTSMDKVTEAEQFLREGLRANPRHRELLFELGRIYRENKQDLPRARNIWELALADWRQRGAAEPEPNALLHEQLLGNLARVEEELGNYPKAIEYLKMLRAAFPGKASVNRWLAELEHPALAPAQGVPPPPRPE